MGGNETSHMRERPTIKSEDQFINCANGEIDIAELEIRKDKTFLLRIPPKLHELAKLKAGKDRIPLHDFIIMALKEKVLSE
jgi:predicted HicB family RNase H-like nuclease